MAAALVDGMVGTACRGADGYVVKQTTTGIAKKYHWTDASFKTEVRALQAIVSPWIVRLLSSCSDTRCCHLDLYDVDLMQVLLDLVPAVTQDEAFKRGAAVALLQALDACHSAHIVHRDVKPENILMKHTPQQFVLCDFGRAAFLGSGKGAPGKRELNIPFSGTYSYAAPEALEGRCCCSNDCWAAGIVLYACLERQMPFDDTSDEERRTLPRAPTLEKTWVWPRWAEPTLLGLFHRRPERRWAPLRALAEVTRGDP